jgi:hypothetical protein
MGNNDDNVPICCTLPGKVIQQHSSKNTVRKKSFNRTVLKILPGKNYSTVQF